MRVRSPQGATRPAAGQDREAEPVVCLVSRWEERRSKEVYSVLAIGLLAAEWGRYHRLRLTNQRRVMSCRPEPAWQWRTSR